jgi:hypothetical protein
LSRKAKRRKLALRDDLVDERGINAAIRSAKKLGRPSKIGAAPERQPFVSRTPTRRRKLKPARVLGAHQFTKDMVSREGRKSGPQKI